MQDLQKSDLMGKYRTESASKPFGIKKPPLASGRAHSGIPGGINRQYVMPNQVNQDAFSQR